MKRSLLKMKRSLLKVIFAILTVLGLILPQFQQIHPASTTIASAEPPPASLVPGLGALHHPVSTLNTDAQRFFDQGLTFIYAYNHYEAAHSFKRAAELDPQLAMAYWGIALAIGPNYDRGVGPAAEKAAYEAVQKALFLASRATENERAYIEALAKRYSIDPNADSKKLAVEYKNAMGELVRRYPDDLDAATLYAESAMDLRPWQLWSPDGKPAEGTEDIVAVLESVLKRDPHHIGANHYYIHAVEASPHSELAFPSAQRLQTLVPASGHLVHMPAHIFARMGDYEAAIRSNEAGAAVDRAYVKNSGVQGTYPLVYYLMYHTLHFLSSVYSMEGRFAEAKKAADQLVANFGPHLKEMPSFEFFMPTPTFVLVRFRRWDDLLRAPEPNPERALTNALWHFGRGMAYAANGRIKDAEAERKIFTDARERIPAEAEVFGRNSASSVLTVAQLVLDSKMAIAKHDRQHAIELLTKAVEAQDALNYYEPPSWFFPIRESLGGVLMMNGNYEEAEQVFRTDLERNLRNGRSLFGLLKSLKAQGKKSEAQWVEREFDAAWKNADIQLRVEDL